MKKLAVALLVIALVITASYAIIAVVTFEKSPVELTEAGLPNEKTQYKAVKRLLFRNWHKSLLSQGLRISSLQRSLLNYSSL